MLISSHAHALIEGPTLEKKNRVNKMEPGLANHSRHPQHVPSCLEPVAFHKTVEECSVSPGTFPTAESEKQEAIPVCKLRQRFFKQYSL